MAEPNLFVPYILTGPTGPQLTFTAGPDASGNALMTDVDRTAPTDPRDRAICRALLLHALRLLNEADQQDRKEA